MDQKELSHWKGHLTTSEARCPLELKSNVNVPSESNIKEVVGLDPAPGEVSKAYHCHLNPLLTVNPSPASIEEEHNEPNQ